jgi:ketosteroid isomerase-like protein
MSAQEDAELVRRGYDAFIAGDMEFLNEHLHENVVWHAPGTNLLSGDHTGREEVLAFFARSVQVALPEFQIHDIVASDDHVVGLSTITWRRNDDQSTFEDHVAQVFHLDGGRVLEVWTMAEDLAGFDEFLKGASG